jgi:hypothetical protein
MSTRQLVDHMFHATLILCTTEDDFYKKIAKYEYDGAIYPSAGAACTISFDTEHHGLVIMVTLGDDALWDTWQTEFMLIHESVHVKQFVLEAVYETNVGVETEAYMVEYYARFLIQEFRRRKLIDSRKK